jgi:competence protein ComEC
MFLLTSPFMWMTASPFISELSGGIYLSSLPVNIMATVFFSFVLGSVLLCGLPVLLGLQFYFLPYCAEKVFHVWAVAADQWTKWLPQALPAGFFPLWFCGGAVTLLTASALKISRWRAVVSAGGVGFVLYCLCEGSL